MSPRARMALRLVVFLALAVYWFGGILLSMKLFEDLAYIAACVFVGCTTAAAGIPILSKLGRSR